MPTFEELNNAKSVQPESLVSAKQLTFDDLSKAKTVQSSDAPQYSKYSINPENFSPNDFSDIDSMIDNDPDLDADEKVILKQNKFHFGENLKDQIEILAGRKEEQKADAESIFTRAIGTAAKDAAATGAVVGTAGTILPGVGNAIGAGTGALLGGIEGFVRGALSEVAGKGLFQKDKRYYWGKDGLAHPYKIGDDLPEGASLEKMFSNRTDSEDDMGTTTFAKGFYNSFVEIGKVVPNLIDLGYGLATGDHLDYIEKINQVIDSEKFTQNDKASEQLVSNKAFTSLAEFANGDNYNVNLHNGMNFIGESTASLFQFLGAAGALKGISTEAQITQKTIQALQAEGRLTPAMKLYMTSALRNPKTWGISAAINLNESMDAMRNAGIEGRKGFALSTLVAAGMGALELSVGGMELNLLSRKAIADDVAKVMSKKLMEDGTEELTEKALKDAWKETMRSGITNMVKRGKEMFVEAIGEGKEEMVQELYTESMQTLYDKYVGYVNNKKPGDGAFGTEMFGPESLNQLFMNGLGGFIGGLVGGKLTKIEKSRDEIIFNAVTNGKKEDLRSKLRTSNLTPEELNDAELKLDAFDHYNVETKDLIKHLDKEQKQEVFSLSFKSENAQRGIAETEKKIEEAQKQGKSTAILEGVKKAYESKMNDANNQIKDIVGNAEKLKAEKEKKKPENAIEPETEKVEPEETTPKKTSFKITSKKSEVVDEENISGTESVQPEKKDNEIKNIVDDQPIFTRETQEQVLPKGTPIFGGNVADGKTKYLNTDLGFEEGDKITFFDEKERTGTWNGKNIIEDETNLPWGVQGILMNPDNWIKKESTVKSEKNGTTNDSSTTEQNQNNRVSDELSDDKKDNEPELTPKNPKPESKPEAQPVTKKITSAPLTEAQQKAIDEEDQKIEEQRVKKLPFSEQVNYHVANAVSNLKSFKPANVKRHNNLSGRESVSEESKQVRKSLKPGDILDVTRVLPETGKKLYPDQSPVHTEGYNYSLEASKDGVHVGSIKYFDVDTETKKLSGSDTEAALKAFDEGREVKLVVVSNSSKGDIGYRVVVGPKKRGRKGKDHTVVLKEIEDRQLEKLDKVRSKLNKFLDDMEGGKGSAKMSVLPIAPALRLAINTGLSVFEKAIKLKKVTRKLWMEAVDAVKDEYGRKKWYNLKQEQRKKIIEMLRNYNTQLSEDMKMITRVEASQEDIEEFADAYDLTMEETKAAMARYGERKQYDENTRRIKSWLYNDLGECVIPDKIVPQLIHELRNHAMSGVVDPKNVAESYESLPTKELAEYLAKTLSDDDFVWMHQHLTSNVPLPVFHIINNGKDGFTIEKSNVDATKFSYLNQLKKAFKAHESAYLVEKNYKTIVNKYKSDIAKFNNDFSNELGRSLSLNPEEIKLINEYNELFDIKFDLKKVSLGRLMYNLRNERNQLFMDEPDSATKAKVLDKVKKLLDKRIAQSNLKHYANANILASLKVAEDLTGIPKEQWQEYLKNQNKSELPYTEFFIDNYLKALTKNKTYTGKTNIELYIIKETFPEFRKNLIETVKADDKKGIPGSRAQLETLAKQLAENTINNGESEYYDNVAGNRKPSAEMISSFEMRARMINSPLIQNHKRLKNNPIVQDNKEKPLRTARYDGVNNRKSKTVAEAKKITGKDLLFSMITAFNDATGKYIRKDEYYHFYNQQGDSSEKLMVALKRRPLTEIKKLVESITPKKDLENELTEIEIFLNEMVSVQNLKNIDPEELAKEFVYNYIYNKYYLDDFFRGNDGKYKPKKENGVYPNAKNTQDLSKRKDYVTGFQMNTEIEGGVGKNHNVCIINDAVGFSSVTQKEFEMFDGQQIILPWYNERVKVSTGNQYGNIIKDIYFKNEIEPDNENGFDPDGSNTMLKGNCILLDEALTEKYPVLKQLYDYALKHDIDRFSFTSTSKLVDPRYVNVVSWNGRDISSLPETPVIYKADNTHVLIQQDLTNDAVLKRDSMLTQPLHIIKGMRSMTKNQKNIKIIEDLLSKAVDITATDFYDEISNLTNEQLKSFYLDAIPNENKYLGIRQFLSNPKTNINSPAYDSFRNSMFSSIVESRLLGIPINKTIGVHIQLPGINLKPMRIENGEIKPGEMIASYNSMKSKKNPRGLDLNENVLIVRVPADDWSSMTVSTVIDNFPPGMKNAVMVDAEYQQGGGMDNDGDTAHIIAKFKDKDGEFVKYNPEDTNDFKGIMNEVLDLIMSEYLRPDIKNNPSKLKEHLSHMQKPIDTDAVDHDIKSYVDKDNSMNKNMPSSVVKMWEANRHSSIVTGLSANAIKVKNYLYGLNATLKKPIDFPQYDTNGNVIDMFSDLKKFKHSDEDQDKINNNMRNNLNQSLDNGKLGKLFYMGKLAATSTIFDYISMLHPDIQSSLIHFMNNSIVKEYIEIYNQASSPLYSEVDQSNVFEVLAKKLGLESGKMVFDRDFNNYVSIKALNNTKNDWHNASIEERKSVFRFLQMLEFNSRDIGMINKVVTMNEKGIKSYGQYVTAIKSYNKVISNKLNSINLTSGGQSIEELDSLKRAKEHISIMKNHYGLDNISMAEDALSSFAKMLGSVKNFFDKNGNPKEVSLTADQINTFYRTFKDAISIYAANVTESIEELREAAKAIYNTFDSDSLIKEYFEVTEDGVMQLVPAKRRMELEADSIKSVQQEFETLSHDQKKTLLKYQIKQFGENTSNNSGGFYQFLPLSILSEHSENIENLDLHTVINNGNYIIQNMLLQNIDMIPMVTIGNINMGMNKLGVLSENNEDITEFAPPVIKAYHDGQIKYFTLSSDENGNEYVDVKKPIDVYRKDIDKTVNFMTAKKSEDNQKMSKINSLNRDESLASVDPELQESIREHLEKMFPSLIEFNDPVAFQEFLDRNYPGQVLDPDALGTEIGNVFYVNPNKALQSTRLHEVAHKYFDMIPDSDPTKSALIKMFGSKYNAIRAIQESHNLDVPGAIEEGIITDLGKKAFDIAQIRFGNSAYAKFMNLMKNFWAALKKAVFPKSLSYEDHLRIMSNRFLENKDEISVFRTSERMRNMKAIPIGEYGKHEDLIKDIQREAGLEGQKDLKNLSTYTVWKMRTKNPEVYHGNQPYLYEIFKTEFPEAFVEDILTTSFDYQFTYEAAVSDLEKYGITPETHPELFEKLKKERPKVVEGKVNNGIQFIGPKMDFNEFILRKTKMTSIQLRGKFSKKAFEETENQLTYEYKEYEKEYREIHELANSIHKVDDVLQWDKKSFNEKISKLRSMDQMISINDSFHSSCLRALSGHYMDMIAVEQLKMESEDSFSGNRLWIKAYHSIMFEGNFADWSGFLANFFGEGVTAPYKSPRDITEKPLQLFQQMREQVYNNYKQTSLAVSVQMDALYKDMQKNKIDLKKHAVYSRKTINPKTKKVISEKETFHEPGSEEFKKMPKVVQEYMTLYFQLLNDDGIGNMANSQDFYTVPQTSADLPELIRKQMQDGSRLGYIRSVGIRLRKDDRYDGIAIKYDPKLPAKTLGDLKAELLDENNLKNSKMKELAVSYKIGQYYRKAKAIVDSGAIFDDGGNYLMKSQIKKVPDPAPFKRDISSTDNVHASIVKYLDQKIMSNKYSSIAPMFEFFEDLYSDNQTPVIHSYIKTLNNKMLYNKNPKDPFARIERYIEFFNSLAVWQMLGFNIKAAGFNVGTGITQNIRDQGFLRTAVGIGRTIKGLKFTGKIDEGFLNTKTFHLLHKFKIVNISRDMEISPGSVLFETVKKVIFSPMAATEYFNIGMTVSGMIPQEIWDNYDNEMNPIPNANPEYILTDDMIRRIVAEASRTHGAYQDMIKRPYGLTLCGRTVNLLRNWLPDVYHAHFASEYIDAHDVTRKGIITSGYDVIKTLGSDPKNFAETARNLSDVDKQNLAKALREMLMTAILMMLYSGYRDDDKEKANIFMKLASDVGFVYDFNNYEALLSAGFPAFRSLLGTIDASKEILKVVTLNPTIFENSSKYAEKGDWKAPIVIMRQIPIVNKYIPKREK